MQRMISFCVCIVLLMGAICNVPIKAADFENYLPSNDGLTKEVWGVKYSCTNGIYHISGTPKKSSFLTLLGGVDQIPKGLREGDRLKIKFQSGTAYITVGLRAFNEENPDGVWLVKTSVDTELVIPNLSAYDGVAIRILVTACDRNFDLNVMPIIEIESKLPNIIPNNDGLTKDVWGVRYSCTDGTYHISGTPKKSSFLTLYGGVDFIPSDLCTGDRLKIKFQSGTAYVTVGLRAFNEENPDGVWLVKTAANTEFVVPDLSAYDGVAIRILVTACDREFDLKVTPIIEKETNIIPDNDGLTKDVWGVKYSCTNGTYHISGTPAKSSTLTLYGGVDHIPSALRAGDRLRIEFNSGTAYVTFGLCAFNAENPNGIWLVKTSVDKDFVVPDLSAYDGVAIRILVTACDREFDLELTPVIKKLEKQKSYLTIIDDDGDIHFLTDVFPMMQEMGVSISTAVTTRRIGSSPRWMSWEQIEYLNANGCEVLNHTYNHYTGTEIQSIDDETIYENYKKARDELLRRGIIGGNYLVYSSSTGNFERVQKVASQVYKCGIKIGGSTINNADSNRFALSRYRIDYASTEGHEDWNLEDMKAYIEEVAFTGGWQIWMFHTSNSIWTQRVCLDGEGKVLLDENGEPIPMVDQNGVAVMDNYGVYPTVGSEVLIPMLREAILYAQAQGVEIVSVHEAYHEIYE